MKKIILFLLALSLSFVLYADGSELTPGEVKLLNAYQYLDMTFSTIGITQTANLNRLTEIAKGLQKEQIDALKNAYQYNTGSAIALNIVTGGMGSIIHDRNKLPGIFLQIMATASLGLTIGGIIVENPALEGNLFLSAQIAGTTAIVSGILLPILNGIRINSRLEKVLGK